MEENNNNQKKPDIESIQPVNEQQVSDKDVHTSDAEKETAVLPVFSKEKGKQVKKEKKKVPEETCDTHKPEVEPDKKENNHKHVEKLSRNVLLILLLLLFVALFPIFKLFLVPLILASCFATLFYPFYLIICRRLRNRRGFSALICCLILLFGLLVPSYVLVHLVTLQTIELYKTTEPKVRKLIQEGEKGISSRIRNTPILKRLRIDKIDWRSSLQDGLLTLGKLSTRIVNRTSTEIFSFITNMAIMLFTMFYFFMDGEKLVKKLRYLSPLRNDYEEMILSRFLLVSRATIKGTLVIGLTQGSLGAITLLIFGVKTWLLWGFVMVILSIIPMVGAWLVMIPTAIVQIMLGNVWQGIGIFLVCTVVVSNVDNLIRPRLIGHGAKMHDLMIFFSTIGGISVFGIMGFVVGPVIAALFITVLEIYGVEYQSELTSAYTSVED